MQALIERLQAATEGSRELDAHVKTFKDGGCGFRWTHAVSGTTYEAFRTDGEQLWCLSEQQIPHYTTSVDAALTLVPERHGYAVIVPSGPLPRCQITTPAGRVWFVSGATPALAVSAAALKAREAE